MSRFTKKDLVSHVKTECGLTTAQAGAAIDAMSDYIISRVSAGDTVALTGFGTFSRMATKGREGINPKTKQKIDIPAGFRPKFKAGKEFKDAIG